MRNLKLIPAILIFAAAAVACSAENNQPEQFLEIEKTGSMELEYAEMFTVDFYPNDLSLITIGDSEQYLLVPEHGNVPENVPDSVTVIQQPVQKIYLAASSAMDLFDGIDSLDHIRMTSTMEKDWALPEVKAAIQSGDILYAGKYSAPDYEQIMDEGCDLAIESTMIYHSPEIKEQLENIGIPVMVERSSYETHPLGRMEWIKLYGLLMDKTADAESIFQEKIQMLDEIMTDESTGKTAAFFYITANGHVNVHKPGDYVSKMIEFAGGVNVLTPEDLNVDQNALSTMNMQFEAFYAAAKDADFLIYNSAIDGGISSIDMLIEKNALLADFKAVKDGNVWCTDKNMFQQTTGAADMIADLHLIFTESSDSSPVYLYHLE